MKCVVEDAVLAKPKFVGKVRRFMLRYFGSRPLDHKEANGTIAAYARAQHLPERRRMMQAWADTCDALETGGEVILLHGRTA
ncbi:MAG: hypothetical protein AB1720_10040 [Pseudomonadota bacterium]|jgi:hypothetical protein